MSPQSRHEAEDGQVVAELVDRALEADAAGIAAICLTEHHLGGFNTYCDPFMMGAFRAGRLSHADPALHIIQVPLRHPMRIVESANVLDLLTRARVMIGLAPGAVKQVEFRHRRDRTRVQAARVEYADTGGTGAIVTAERQGLVGGRRTPSQDWRERQQSRAQVAVAGTPAMVIDHLLRYRDVGVAHACVALITVPGRSEPSQETLRLFLAEVLPHLDPQPLPDPVDTRHSLAAG
jgi:alkanesulfonate monooxygenase SsuD/methylene tetrahydromethanopterin reductase-like flavin-dependent oxidoreductase (luciferase family)